MSAVKDKRQKTFVRSEAMSIVQRLRVVLTPTNHFGVNNFIGFSAISVTTACATSIHHLAGVFSVTANLKQTNKDSKPNFCPIDTATCQSFHVEYLLSTSPDSKEGRCGIVLHLYKLQLLQLGHLSGRTPYTGHLVEHLREKKRKGKHH